MLVHNREAYTIFNNSEIDGEELSGSYYEEVIQLEQTEIPMQMEILADRERPSYQLEVLDGMSIFSSPKQAQNIVFHPQIEMG